MWAKWSVHKRSKSESEGKHFLVWRCENGQRIRSKKIYKIFVILYIFRRKRDLLLVKRVYQRKKVEKIVQESKKN